MADTTTTVTSSAVPAVAAPYVSSLLANTANLTDPNKNPYAGMSAYGDETGQTPFAELNPGQIKAATDAMNMSADPSMAKAAGMAGAAGIGSLTAGQNYASTATDPNAMQSWMSPYMQNVVDQQKQGAIRDYSRSLPGLGFGGARAGGLGGSRSALVQAEAQRNLGNRLGDIQATGLQNAWGDANKNMQYGADLGLRGMGQANTAAGTLGNIGSSTFGQNLDASKNLQNVSKDMYGIAAGNKAATFADWQAMKNDPLAKQGIMSSVLKNIPLSGGTVTSTAPGSSTAADIAGILGGLGGIWSAFK